MSRYHHHHHVNPLLCHHATHILPMNHQIYHVTCQPSPLHVLTPLSCHPSPLYVDCHLSSITIDISENILEGSTLSVRCIFMRNKK